MQEDGKILTRRMTKKYILAVEKHSRILWRLAEGPLNTLTAKQGGKIWQNTVQRMATPNYD